MCSYENENGKYEPRTKWLAYYLSAIYVIKETKRHRTMYISMEYNSTAWRLKWNMVEMERHLVCGEKNFLCRLYLLLFFNTLVTGSWKKRMCVCVYCISVTCVCMVYFDLPFAIYLVYVAIAVDANIILRVCALFVSHSFFCLRICIKYIISIRKDRVWNFHMVC